MRKIFAMLLAVSVASMLAPTTSAETVTGSYTGAIGASEENTGSTGLVVCPSGCDFNTPETGGAVPIVEPIGGLRMIAAGSYSNVIGSIQDDIFGDGAAMKLCFYGPDDDFVCDGVNDYSSDVSCGGTALLGAPFAASAVTFFLYNVHVTADLNVCGATTGSVTGTFF